MGELTHRRGTLSGTLMQWICIQTLSQKTDDAYHQTRPIKSVGHLHAALRQAEHLASRVPNHLKMRETPSGYQTNEIMIPGPPTGCFSWTGPTGCLFPLSDSAPSDKWTTGWCGEHMKTYDICEERPKHLVVPLQVRKSIHHLSCLNLSKVIKHWLHHTVAAARIFLDLPALLPAHKGNDFHVHQQVHPNTTPQPGLHKAWILEKQAKRFLEDYSKAQQIFKTH